MSQRNVVSFVLQGRECIWKSVFFGRKQKLNVALFSVPETQISTSKQHSRPSNVQSVT